MVITDVCANNANGGLSVPLTGPACASGKTLFPVDDASAPIQTCVLSSNGAIRRVTSASQCVQAPRSKKETPFVIPSLTLDFYLCATNSDGTLFFKGTSPVNCKAGQYLVVIENANEPPVANGQSVTLNEDGSLLIALTGSDPDGQPITFKITDLPDHGQLFKGNSTAAADEITSVPTTIPSSGTSADVTYKPAANYFGADSFEFKTNDSFVDSAAGTVSVTVNPVNDAPSFTSGGDVTVGEDSGAYSAGWAIAISAGPANESGQTVTFGLTNNNPAVFSSQPAVSATGVLSFTPAANANGSAIVSVFLSDNGGTANGGIDTSPTQSFTITVSAVNDPPTFTGGGNVSVAEDAGAYGAAWASAISPGPADESGQTVTFFVSNDNNALFSAQPAVASNGTLSFTPAADAFGSANLTVTAQDSEGASSAPQAFTITVTPVNDPPSFTKGADQTVNEDATAQSVFPWATAISAGPPNESEQTLQFAVVSNDNPSLFAPISGLPTVDAATGTLTYTPALNANGVATIELELTDSEGGESATQTFTITVNAVNDEPTFTVGGDQTVNEDAGAQSVPGFANGSAGPPNESGQTLTYTVANDNNALFSAQPAIDTNGTLTYTPAANANGSATVSVSLTDDGGTANGGDDTSAAQTYDIDVTAVNDEPSFDLPASPNQTVVQDAGPQMVPGFATNISAGPSDESGQTLTFNVSNDNNALFATQPAIDASGQLTYESASGATGTALVSVALSDDGGTANGGDNTSPTQQFTIAVAVPNEAPVAAGQTGGSAVAATEDGSAVTITLTATDADDDDLTFAIVASPTRGSLGTIGTPDCTTTANTCTATVGFTPAANENGADSFTFKANDGTFDSNTATVEISITAVNDAPSFTKGADDTVLEDSGARTVNGWATNISPGPANEPGQTVSFTITNNTNAALFSAAPSVNSSGDLSYTPAANAVGSATITLKAVDNGTPPAESPTQSFVIDVTAVNDAPVNTVPAAQSVNEDTDLTFSSANGNAISVADVDAGAGALQVTVSALNGTITPATGSGATIGGSGTATATITGTPTQVNAALNGLEYRGNANFNQTRGSETLTVATSDQGNSGAGGAQSDSDNVAVTVNAVNDAPVAQPKAFTVQANMKIGLTGLLTGATDPDTGDSGYTASFTSNVSIGAGCLQGTISNQNAADGTFDFDPPPGVTGTSCTLSYTVTDSGSPGPGATSAHATISMTINGPVIWFVNPAAASNGNGRLSSPFNVLSGADAVDAANHRVFVYSGSTATGLALNSGEWLIGQGATNAPTNTFDALMGITPPDGTIARPAIGGTRPTIGGTVALNTNARVQGLNITASGVTALADSGGHSGVAVSEAAASASGAAAVDLNATGGSIALSSTSSSGSAGSGIALTNVAASFTGGTGSISNAAGTAVAISGGDGAFDYDGSITDDLGALVTVASTAGGTKSLDGAISDGNDGDGNGISLTGNAAATTINFAGGLTLSTGANAAFTATGGGTVNVTGTNTLATTTATALNVANTTIGASGLTFQSIASSGGSSTGIILDNTGTTAGLTVTGTGTAGSGGTIANKTGTDGQTASGIGIYLNNTKSPSFTRMQLNDFQNYAIRGFGVNGFTLVNSVVSGTNGNNDAVDEGAVYFTNLTGSASLSGNALSGGWEDNLNVTNTSGTLNRITVSGPNCTIGLNSTSFGNDGVHFESHNTGTVLNSTVQNCTFTGARGDWYFAATIANGSADAVFADNTLSNAHTNSLPAGVRVVVSANGPTTFDIHDNTLQGSTGSAIFANAAASQAVASGRIEDNTIGVVAVPNSGSSQSSGIEVASGSGGGDMVALVDGNVVRQYNGHGIHLNAGDQAGNPPTFQVTVTNNTVSTPGTLGPLATGWNGIHLNNGFLSSDNFTSCVDIKNNSVAASGAGVTSPNNNDVRLRQRQATTVTLPGYAGANNNNAAVQAFLSTQNTLLTVNASNTVPTGGGYVGGAACTQP